MSQRYRVPVGILVFILIGVVALVSIDVALLAKDPARFRADLRLVFALAATGAALWLAVRLVRTWLEQMNRHLLDRIDQMAMVREGPTIPMQPVRIIASAAVPIRPEDVIAMPSPDTVAAMRRLAAKVTRATE